MCNNTILSFPSPLKMTAPCKKRRSVRFDEDSSSRRVKRKVVELFNVPKSSDMTEEERSSRWMQRSDHRATYQDVNQVISSCQEPDDSSAYLHFATALATTYNLCNSNNPNSFDSDDNDSDDDTAQQVDIDEANAQSKLPLDQLVLLGCAHTASRGLETKIIPGLGSHRLQARREHSQKVLRVQRELGGLGIDSSDMAEGLGSISELLSQPSRRFARALGVVDGTLALLEYASDNEESESSACNAVDEAPEGIALQNHSILATPVVA
ncbi:expressed unknown protein [Seminavis robusta]|uniref:Uncharacterized protein n=1 Tax=Seminavis robusta TaxID=568900 RepID=A0A9N8DIW8_9STRA|nr:expressed unknown protein [Seminavis robusta]|eukprot:Sro167_g074310.1 n/a (267) ;mRNA; f:7794-8594